MRVWHLFIVCVVLGILAVFGLLVAAVIQGGKATGDTPLYSSQTYFSWDEVEQMTVPYKGDEYATFRLGATGSMMPMLSENAKPLFILTDNVTIGDVILYPTNNPDYPNDPLTCHRIVGEQGEYWITKGDANPEPDPWLLPKSEVIGRLVKVIY